MGYYGKACDFSLMKCHDRCADEDLEVAASFVAVLVVLTILGKS